MIAVALGVTPLLILIKVFGESSPPGADRALLAYASTQDSVRLADGRTIHLVCMGQGSPVVILTTGGGDWSIGWNKVQPAVARTTRVCAWDRPGFGLSSPTSKPETADETTTDLQAALKAAGLAGPYVVVGASLGGYESVLLADREPSEVVGMVLVDPAYPDQYAQFARVAPALADFWNPPPEPRLAACAEALRAGTRPPDDLDPHECLHPRWPSRYPTELRTALTDGPAEATPQAIASSVQTLLAENTPAFLEADSKIAIKPGRNYGDMPLVVLTADDHQPPPIAPYLSAAAKAEVPAFIAEWRRGHDAYAALSTRGVDRTVPDSTHDIPQSNPQAVVGAIDEVVDKARASGSAKRAR
ncbi:MAG TPA: alpha/beta hydrolase [Caulobacteraceae bacterium]|nr:alpha/beta hydrolase [Caulobacteraceae bacterium]